MKSQVNAFKAYSEWAKPYLIATRKLLPPEKIHEAEEIVTAFDVARIYLVLFGKKEIKTLTRGEHAIARAVKISNDEDLCIQAS